MTRFYVRNLRKELTAEFKRVKRGAYRRIARKNSESGRPFRVGTRYVDGVPYKRLTELPYPPGDKNFSETVDRLRLPLPPRV